MSNLTEFTTSHLVQRYELPKEGELVIVQKVKEGPKRAHFRCPCGCHMPIMVCERGAVDKGSDNNYWDITRNDDGTWTINPSVNMSSLTSCRSHYFVKHNKVIWV